MKHLLCTKGHRNLQQMMFCLNTNVFPRDNILHPSTNFCGGVLVWGLPKQDRDISKNWRRRRDLTSLWETITHIFLYCRFLRLILFMSPQNLRSEHLDLKSMKCWDCLNITFKNLLSFITSKSGQNFWQAWHFGVAFGRRGVGLDKISSKPGILALHLGAAALSLGVAAL